MAFEDLITKLRVLLAEMEKEPKDLHEMLEHLHHELNLMKATGHALPDDLLRLESQLEKELLPRRKAKISKVEEAPVQTEETIGLFGFHLVAGEAAIHPAYPTVQIYVKSSSLSRVADLAISQPLATTDEIDQFFDKATAALKEIHIDAKIALADANAR